jgi:hypothetical protein
MISSHERCCYKKEITHTTLSGFDIRNKRTADAMTTRTRSNFHSPEVTL